MFIKSTNYESPLCDVVEVVIENGILEGTISEDNSADSNWVLGGSNNKNYGDL